MQTIPQVNNHGPVHISHGLQALRKTIIATAGPPTTDICPLCAGMTGKWAPVAYTTGGLKLCGILEIQNYKRGLGYRADPVISEAVEPCPECSRFRVSQAANNFGQKFLGKLVDEEMVKYYTPYLLDLAGSVPDGSCLLYGETGVGKTLLAKAWYNRILQDRGGIASDMTWMTERQLFDALGEKNGKEERQFLLSQKYIFVDESYEDINHKDQSGDNTLTARNRQSNYREFINTIYETGQPWLCATSNNLPELIIHNGYMQRRHKAIFTYRLNLDDRKKPQGDLDL